jgi:hypothetical protein
MRQVNHEYNGVSPVRDETGPNRCKMTRMTFTFPFRPYVSRKINTIWTTYNSRFLNFCLHGGSHFLKTSHSTKIKKTITKLNSLAWVLEGTIPTERLPLVGKVSAPFADTECHVVSVTDPYNRILDFLGRSRYYFFQVAPQLYSRGRVDPSPDPLLLRKSGSAGFL